MICFVEILHLTPFLRYHIQQDQFLDRDEPLITHVRHRLHLETALCFLQAFLDTRES